VDFADNLIRQGEGVVRAGSLFPSLAPSPARPRTYRPPSRHEEPAGDPKFENYAIDYGKIPIALGQTFGVEIELTEAGGVPSPGQSWRAPGPSSPG
jgi:hypothetical protein